MTSTVAPLGMGLVDQARYASVPPRIFSSTSPGPAFPRVATMTTPMEPIRDWSPATASVSLLAPECGSTHYRPAGAMRVTLASAMAVPGAGIAAGAAALETVAGVLVSPGPQLPSPSRNTVRLEPRCATRRGGDRTPAPRVHAPVETPAHGG